MVLVNIIQRHVQPPMSEKGGGGDGELFDAHQSRGDVRGHGEQDRTVYSIDGEVLLHALLQGQERESTLESTERKVRLD